MNKHLEDMTNEALGKLFPVFIAEPDPDWGRLFLEEASRIREILWDQNTVRIGHIGSTAVPGLKAKPTIDILLEVPLTFNKDKLIENLVGLDYHYTPKPENPAPHMMFMKGYTIDGFRGQAYHIHVRYPGDQDEIFFRDYLRTHPETAREYGELKIRLAEQFRNDREGYTDGKTSFVKRITGIAGKEKCELSYKTGHKE
jgi:GrpB-like predicted nucleotidyltransferase (UPF0157 family)